MTGDLNEDDNQLILRQYKSHFVTYEIPPGNYTLRDISDAVYTMGDQEGTLKLENEDVSMKIKLVFNSFRWYIWNNKI